MDIYYNYYSLFLRIIFYLLSSDPDASIHISLAIPIYKTIPIIANNIIAIVLININAIAVNIIFAPSYSIIFREMKKLMRPSNITGVSFCLHY